MIPFPTRWNFDEATGRITDDCGQLVAEVPVKNSEQRFAGRLMAAAPRLHMLLESLAQQVEWAQLGDVEPLKSDIQAAQVLLGSIRFHQRFDLESA